MKLGETDLVQNVNVRLFSGTDMINSVGPIAHFGETETLRKGSREFALRIRWELSLISVRPKHYEGKQRVCNPISMRPRSLSVTELIRVSGYGYVK